MLERAIRITEVGLNAGAKEDFLANTILYESTLRNIEILGEAAKNVPEEVRILAPSIPWRVIARTRDILAHIYFGVDDDVIWQIVTISAPALIAPLKSLLSAREELGEASQE